MKKILIIEDEKMLREMYVGKLKQAGFQVAAIAEAEGALELAKKEKPDLVLLDILLPRADGFSFLKQLREDQTISNIKVVAFSNYDNPEARAKAKKLKATAYLLKANFTPRQIVEKVKEYLK